MATHDKNAIELNEVEWWSKWGGVRWLGSDSYVLSSDEFQESFFNRAGFLNCRAPGTDLELVEAEFRRNGHAACLTLLGSCGSSIERLEKLGYSLLDTMTVQSSGPSSIPANDEVVIQKASQENLNEWVETYLLSFYGDLAMKAPSLRVAKRLSRLDDVLLLLASIGGKVAGVTALYRSPGLMGLYCLGTLPELRGKGVARSLLGWAQREAGREKRQLVLQSLASEETEPYYSKFGFRRLYTKQLLVGPKNRPGIGRVEGESKLHGTLIRKDPGVGLHLFSGVFEGFEKVAAVRSIFGSETKTVLAGLPVEVVDEEGYMHIDAPKGSVIVSASYLKEGDERYLYLDIIHELVHIRQHIEGKELWDRRYKYVDRPTELEAYKIAIDEARRIGLAERQLVDYLRVEWVSEEDFNRFLTTLGVRRI